MPTRKDCDFTKENQVKKLFKDRYNCDKIFDNTIEINEIIIEDLRFVKRPGGGNFVGE